LCTSGQCTSNMVLAIVFEGLRFRLWLQSLLLPLN
jgi:hypothetical protein